MQNEFTAIIERDGEWYIAYCLEIPGANGQGKTKEEAIANIREAIRGYVAALEEDHLTVPEERFETILVTV